jgi:DNA-binding Xre family transcriptional regulator
MLSTEELCALLRHRKIKGTEVAALLGVNTAAVTRLYKGKRFLKVDEAKKLIEHFNLAEASPGCAPPLSVEVSRLLILHIANSLRAKVHPDDPRVADLASDLRHVSIFALNSGFGESTKAVDGFLSGMKVGRGLLDS